MRFTMRHDRGRCLAVRLTLGMGLLLVPLGMHAQSLPDDGARAETSTGNGMPADILATKAFLLATYPDLMGRELELTVRREGEAVLVSVVDRAAPRAEPLDSGRPAPEPALSEPRGFSPGETLNPRDPAYVATPVLTARFEFDTDTRLRRYDAYGPLVHEAEALALQMQLLANPRWLDSDADAWLAQRGVTSTFAPASAAVVASSAAVTEQLTSVSPLRTSSSSASSEPRGFSLGVISAPARFVWHTAGTTAAGAPVFRSRPAWVTEATVADPDGQSIVYQLEYEPFGGRLIAVTSEVTR